VHTDLFRFPIFLFFREKSESRFVWKYNLARFKHTAKDRYFMTRRKDPLAQFWGKVKRSTDINSLLDRDLFANVLSIGSLFVRRYWQTVSKLKKHHTSLIRTPVSHLSFDRLVWRVQMTANGISTPHLRRFPTCRLRDSINKIELILECSCRFYV